MTRDATVRLIDARLERVRSRLARLTPQQAAQALADGAVLVDIRPPAQGAREGEIPESLVIERNVLEWRFDPTNAARLPIATGHDLQAVVVCSEGYTSSLAASRQELGLRRATDLEGGFLAWRDAGLPTIDGGRDADG